MLQQHVAPDLSVVTAGQGEGGGGLRAPADPGADATTLPRRPRGVDALENADRVCVRACGCVCVRACMRVRARAGVSFVRLDRNEAGTGACVRVGRGGCG